VEKIQGVAGAAGGAGAAGEQFRGTTAEVGAETDV
jgi:hypothetical protein